MKCSRCGKEIKNMLIQLQQKIDVYKITEDNLYIKTENLSEPTNEFLCQECFSEYADCIDQLNQKYEKLMNGANMVEVVDDVQYGEDPHNNII